jgi:hypothetical protein
MLDNHGVYIASVARTPIGILNGSLSTYSAVDLGAIAVRAAVERVSYDETRLSSLTQSIDEVLMGHVYSANVGQAPATQVAIKAGLPTSIPSTSINKVCSSGMKCNINEKQGTFHYLNDMYFTSCNSWSTIYSNWKCSYHYSGWYGKHVSDALLYIKISDWCENGTPTIDRWYDYGWIMGSASSIFDGKRSRIVC